MNDLVARMGGDEFVVVATLMPDREAIDALAVRLQAAIGAAIMINDEPLTVSASIGIAVYPDDGLQIDSLLKNADIALYQAKEAGRACHRFFQSDMDLRLSEHVALEQALRHAIGSKQIFLEYQPIIDLNTGRVASLEALMRWRHPDRGLIPPSRFIPVAEQSGLIVELGQQALREAVAQLREWLDADVPVVPIAVNVSPLQLERLDFAGTVTALSKERGLDPRWLRFEITESAVMKEPDKLIATLRTLRELGSQILIDDFGTGYSSLSYLNRLPVDVLKIDRAFVRDLGKGTEDKPIVGAVIDLARKLSLVTVAEGVETAEQAAFLREQGCDYAQGYHYSKPIPATQCRWLLQQLRREHPLTQTMAVRVTSEEFLEAHHASQQ
jgi:predicted signal transduction protein with EAL and GGDEF domain